MIDKKIYIKEDKLLNAFKLFDFDNDGKMSEKEVSRVLKGININNESFNQSINKFDLDGDKELDYNEFVEMMNKLNF